MYAPVRPAPARRMAEHENQDGLQQARGLILAVQRGTTTEDNATSIFPGLLHPLQGAPSLRHQGEAAFNLVARGRSSALGFASPGAVPGSLVTAAT